MKIQNLGVIMKRPFCWLQLFSVNSTYYGVGSIYHDKTSTRKKEWYDHYFLGLFKVKNLVFSDDIEESERTIIDVEFEQTKPIEGIFFPFYETFSPEALNTDEDGNMTAEAKKIYTKEENAIISKNLFAKAFPEVYQTELHDMLFE